MSERIGIGIIGGTGLYQMEGFTDVREVAVETPFGPPSDRLMLGQLEGRAVAFLPRHGRGHRILPHELNFQANLFAMKSLGVEFLLSVSAVGSLKEEYAPLDMVVPDQFIDRTQQRRSTFFGRGLVAHVAFAHPFCRALLEADGRGLPGGGRPAPRRRDLRVHRGPAVLDPRRVAALPLLGRGRGRHDQPAGGASSRARRRSATRRWRWSTDYDCWHPEHDAVTADSVMKVLGQNVATARAVLRAVVRRLPIPRACECEHALRHALLTAPELVPAAVKRELAPIMGRYLR